MATELMNPLRTSRMAELIGRAWDGEDVLIERITALTEPADDAMSFATSAVAVDDSVRMCLITTPDVEVRSAIRSPNPRLDFARAIAGLRDARNLLQYTDTAQIDESASVSDLAVVGRGVVIGARTIVEPFVRLVDGSQIGSDCWLRTGAVIGEQGFGFERDEENRPVRLHHLGGVAIGHRVEVGSLSTVCQGTLSPTVIEDDVKLDDHVHVGHNCRVGESTMIAAFAELSGGVVVGRRVWIGPHASTLQHVRIGDDAVIGVGAVVLRNVRDGATVMGRPGIESKG